MGGGEVPDLFSLPAALKALDNVHAGSLLAAQQGREGGGGSGGARILASGQCSLGSWGSARLLRGLLDFSLSCAALLIRTFTGRLCGVQLAGVSALGCEFPPGGLTIHSPGWAPRADLGLGGRRWAWTPLSAAASPGNAP